MANEPASDGPGGNAPAAPEAPDASPARADKRTRFAAGPAPVPVPRVPSAPPPVPASPGAGSKFRKTMMGAPSTVTPPKVPTIQPPAQTGLTVAPPGHVSPARTGQTLAPPSSDVPVQTGRTLAPPSAERRERPKTEPSIRNTGPVPVVDAPPVEDEVPAARSGKRNRETAPAMIHRGTVPPEPKTAVTGEHEVVPTQPDARVATTPLPPKKDVATADTQIFGEASPLSATNPTGSHERTGDRAERAGTMLHGMEGLVEPGGEHPKIRLTPGRQIPGTRWRIERWLGEGGMGVVYEASHVDIERRSALKILRFDLSQQERMVQVFRDEARAASRLGSPHIVEIFDFGELSDGRLFFSMEMLQGSDLVPDDENVSMTPGRLIGIMRQVCKGLAVAHEGGVVHRDVKPENIIVIDQEGRPDFVKLVDFGISSMLAAGQSGAGGIAGTPHYMAPEQILGDRFDGRLDVYAVGCTAYELLVGRPPFDDDDVEKILQMQVNETPIAPRALRPDLSIPVELETVIMRCLAKAPEARYDNMAELEAALCEAQIAAGLTTPWDDLPVPALPDAERRARIVAKMPTAKAPAPKRSLVWPIVAGFSTVAAAGLAAFVLLGGPTDEDKTVVDALASEARDAAVRADWVYPPPDEPEAPTAFRKVLELEGLEGSADDLGEERAEELRIEFSEALDRYGDRALAEGAKKQAREFYMWALAFNENDKHALERVDMPLAFIADFRKRAEAGDFSEMEIIVGRMAGVQTIEDASAKEKAEQRIVAAAADNPDIDMAVLADAAQDSAVAEKALEQTRARRARRGSGIDAAEATPPPRKPRIEEDDDVPVVEEDDDVEDPEVVGDEPEGKATAKGRAPKGAKKKTRKGEELLGEAERDPTKAAQLADEGAAAYRSGQRGNAASLFNQAIAYDRGNATALMGLSDIYFDQGKNEKAVVYAEKAVRASPSNKNYRIKLGDAYYKVLRYKDALAQYEKAKALGATKADDRISKVKSKLGG